jgi:hypothetical protein
MGLLDGRKMRWRRRTVGEEGRALVGSGAVGVAFGVPEGEAALLRDDPEVIALG